jgi:hypothetical protein
MHEYNGLLLRNSSERNEHSIGSPEHSSNVEAYWFRRHLHGKLAHE